MGWYKGGYRGNNAREEGTIQGKGGTIQGRGGGQHRKEQYKGRGVKQYKGGRMRLAKDKPSNSSTSW